MTLVIDRIVGARVLAVLLAAALGWPGPALGQGAAPAQSAAPADQPLGPQELEQIVAPVALYPDPLLAQVFMASTYPLEVVEARRWQRQNESLKGAQLDDALKKQTWDDSVKSLVSFPPVLTMMNDKLDWTQKLGDAFLGQQKDVMDAVQRLRAKAQAQGNLASNKEQTVSTEPAPAPPPPAAPPAAPAPSAPAPATTQTTVIKIEPANPQVVYVPTYNPTVVYGAWPYPAYPPYYYYPPGYAAATFATAAISFGVGMAVGSALWGGCNWGRGDVNVNVNRYNSFTQNVNTANLQNRVTNTNVNRSSGNASTWSHNPDNRRGTQYRDSASQQRYGKGNPAGADSREAFRGRAAEGRQELQRGAADQFRQGGTGDRPGQGQGAGGGSVGDRAGQGQRPGGGSLGDRGGQGQGAGGGSVGDRAGQGQRPGGGSLGDRAGQGQGAGGGSAGDRAGQAQRQGSGGLSDRSGAGGGTGQARGGGAFQGVGSGSQARDYGNRGQASISQARGGAAGGVQRGGGGGGSRGGGGRRR